MEMRHGILREFKWQRIILESDRKESMTQVTTPSITPVDSRLGVGQCDVNLLAWLSVCLVSLLTVTRERETEVDAQTDV
ncbi:hypothetical protein E2C01_054661 [Portunus trituberculatus]|uniref:Uncharacterized protein n=1 Tax=Portunus trituberculatus TaxID=210409 RepID=A0A5B7GUC2_PORTR|nr:hypothetical protein [Portunus trituberculatus]